MRKDLSAIDELVEGNQPLDNDERIKIIGCLLAVFDVGVNIFELLEVYGYKDSVKLIQQIRMLE